ncbi:MAG: hypothetical protein GF364_19290 [Candidatus Lokiarchaeota archaeon]|nr:hypothetical protein [Candidatus Lokiarchaeota archaeon]
MKEHILIIGFEEFGEYSRNYSGELASGLNRLKIKKHQIIGDVFSINFFELDEKILNLLHIYKPKVVLITQIANVNKVVFDIFAQNMVRGNFKDEQVKKSKIARGLPITKTYKTSLPVVEICDYCEEKNISYRINRIPSCFIANYCFFYTLYFQQLNQVNFPVGLIRIPYASVELKKIIEIYEKVFSLSLNK